MARNFTQIVQTFMNFIRGTNSKIELSEGTFTQDVVIEAPAREFENLYVRAEQVSLEQGINTASDIGLTQIGNNFSKTSKSARRARGLVTFFKNTEPLNDIVIVAGTLVSTPLSTSVESVLFRTTQTITMRRALALSYYNSTTSLYEIQVEVEAVNGGSFSNVGAGTITVVNNAIAGIDGVYNSLATSGGVDAESNTDFASRLSQSLAGISVGTKAGFMSFVLEQDGVQDVLVISKGQSNRSEIGAVDVYVKGKIFSSATDEFYSTTSPYPDFKFSKQPVISDGYISVISSVSGVLPVASWTIQKDVSAYGGSIQASDTLHWNTTVTTASGSIIVSYQYNGLVETLQSLLANENQDVLNASTLIKWAIELPIDVTLSIRLLPGFSSSDVVPNVQTAISNFLNSLGIGEECQQSDMLQQILNVAGIDDVALPITTFQSHDGSVIRDAFGNLTIPVTSYCSSGTITVNLF